MSMYNRFANDLSDNLFNSVYCDLYTKAKNQQAAIYASCKKFRKKTAPADYYIGEHQLALNAFCANKLSLGAALDHIKYNGS